MSTFKVRVFEVADRTDGGAPARPEEKPGFTVQADDVDKARTLAQQRLVERGHKLRSVSCSPDGVVAYVHGLRST